MYSDAMNLEAFVLGCGGMMPLPYRHLTSVLLRRDGDLFLFDGGEGTQVSLRRLNLKWKKINAIFVSHTHADHVTGLPGIMMLSSQVDRNEPLYIIVKEITEPGIVHRGEDFHIRAFPLSHTKPCVGYTLEEDERPGVFNPEAARALRVPCGPLWSVLQSGKSVTAEDGSIVTPEQVMGNKRSGRKFSYVTDTQYLPTIAPEVAHSDLLICEGMFSRDMEDQAREKKHMTSVQSATIAKDAQVKQMGLIHYSPRYTDYDLDVLLKEAQSVFPNTVLTRDRMVFDIPYEE